MKKRLFSLLVIAVVALSVVQALPQHHAAAQGDLGSEGNPIQVYFVPSVEASVIVSGGEVMAQALKEATGLNFEVFVPTSYAATIEAMCAAPDKTIGFIPAAGYVIANNRCGVEVGAAAVRFGWPVYWAEYIVRRDSDIFTFGDLAGKTWGYGDHRLNLWLHCSLCRIADRWHRPRQRSADGWPQPDRSRRVQWRSGLWHDLLQPAAYARRPCGMELRRYAGTLRSDG